MTDQVSAVEAIVADMKLSSEKYFTGATAIWNLLSLEDRIVLGRFFGFKPQYKSEVKDREHVDRLLSYKLLTWTTYMGNEGYITGTFLGAAVLKNDTPDSSNVTLPGDKTPS